MYEKQKSSELGTYHLELGKSRGCTGFDGDRRRYGKRAADPGRVKTGNIKLTDENNFAFAA